MQHTIVHDLGVDLARKTAECALATYAKRYPQANIAVVWALENQAQIQLKVGKFRISPRVDLHQRTLVVTMDVPLLARPFEPKIRARIEIEVARWLDLARRDQLLIVD